MPSDGKFVPTFAPPPKKPAGPDSEASGVAAIPAAAPRAITPTPTPLDGESSGSIAADTIARLRQAAMQRAQAKSERVGQPQSFEELENQVRALEIQLESANSINAGLQRQINDASAADGAETEGLRVRLVAAEARVRDVEEESIRLQGLAGEAEALRIELQDQASEAKGLRDERDAANRELEELRRENARLDELVRQQDEILAQLQGMAPQMDEMQSEIMRLRPLESDHMAALERVQELETQVRRAMDEVDQSAVHSAEIQGERDTAAAELNQVRTELGAAQSDLQQARAALDEATAAGGESAEQAAAAAALKIQLSESQEALEAAYAQLDQANAAIEEANQQIDQANAASDYHQAELERMTQALETHYQGEFERIQMEYEGTILQLQEAAQFSEASQSDTTHLQSELETMRQQVEIGEDERRQLARQVEDYRAGAEQHQVGESEWADRERAMLEELGELRSKLEHTEATNLELKRSVDSLHTERDAVGQDAEFVLSELERSQHRVSELEARLDAMHVESQQAVADLEALRHTNEELHQQLESGASAPTPAPPGGSGNTAQYEAEMEMARQIISNLEQQCEAYESRISKLNREMTELRAKANAPRGRQY
jgi:DNA repair exonuclease SbcCD ATPase subunit